MQLNDHLQSRTFLVGRSLTLADLVVFGVAQPATVRFDSGYTRACMDWGAWSASRGCPH